VLLSEDCKTFAVVDWIDSSCWIKSTLKAGGCIEGVDCTGKIKNTESHGNLMLIFIFC